MGNERVNSDHADEDFKSTARDSKRTTQNTGPGLNYGSQRQNQDNENFNRDPNNEIDPYTGKPKNLSAHILPNQNTGITNNWQQGQQPGSDRNFDQYLQNNRSIPNSPMDENKYFSNRTDGTKDMNNQSINSSGNQYNNPYPKPSKMTQEEQQKRNNAISLNNLFSNNRYEDAKELWKKANYEPLDGYPIERTCNLLHIMLKISDREIDYLKKTLKTCSLNLKDLAQKDDEIVELFAEVELKKNQIKKLETQSVLKEQVENKLNKIIKENVVLYKENVKLKTMIQQENWMKDIRSLKN